MLEKPHLAIDDVARLTGTTVITIRVYESGGLLPKAERTASGRRIYHNADANRLTFIRQSRNLGFPLDEVHRLLTFVDDAYQLCEAVDRIARLHLAEIDQEVADLPALCSELGRIIGLCKNGTVADCKITETLAPRVNE